MFAGFYGKTSPTSPFQAAEVANCGVGKKCTAAHTDTIDVNDLKSIDNNKMQSNH